MKTPIVLTIAIVAQAAGNVFLTRGMKAVAIAAPENPAAAASTFAQVLDAAGHAVQSPDIWAGTVLLILFFALCSAAVSWADVSFVLPATAAGYVLNVAAGRYLLHESVPPERWIGALVILLGVVFVSRSSARTTPVETPPAGTMGRAS